VIVQRCVKGMSLPGDDLAKAIIDDKSGIQCRWWGDVRRITPAQIRGKLTPDNIEMHVNQFTARDPMTNRKFCETTPFISLTAGTIERDTILKTNVAHSARRVALAFGSDFGREPVAYLFYCWLVIAPRRAVEVQGVAEEVRDLNTYRSYSAYQTEGEIAAKIEVPANQIERCEKWSITPWGDFTCDWIHVNGDFAPPETLSNIRGLIL
jgi:hypothetical protein